jgi:hypothetical protein
MLCRKQTGGQATAVRSGQFIKTTNDVYGLSHSDGPMLDLHPVLELGDSKVAFFAFFPIELLFILKNPAQMLLPHE